MGLTQKACVESNDLLITGTYYGCVNHTFVFTLVFSSADSLTSDFAQACAAIVSTRGLVASVDLTANSSLPPNTPTNLRAQ